jgi:2-succinyl-6-hydroxy-2,4-cyclohexadiene-1-carboxylate synthase
VPGTPTVTQHDKNFEETNNSLEESRRSGLASGLWTESSGRGPRVVFLHGFTQAGRSWDPVLHALRCLEAELEAEFGAEFVLPDLPGHGRSSHVQIDLNVTADLLAQSYGPAYYVGYSMGGRVALHVGVRHPSVVRGLLLFGATPGLESDPERSERRRADEELAHDLENVGVPAFLERWLRSPLFATLPRNPEDLQLRQKTPSTDWHRVCG